MSDWQDRATFGLKVATDVLFIKNPMGTALGFFAGAVMHGIYGYAQDTFVDIKYFKAQVGMFYFMALGIAGFNVGPYLGRNKVPKDIENALKLISQQELDGAISKVIARQEYRNLIKKVVERVHVDSSSAGGDVVENHRELD